MRRLYVEGVSAELLCQLRRRRVLGGSGENRSHGDEVDRDEEIVSLRVTRVDDRCGALVLSEAVAGRPEEFESVDVRGDGRD